MNLPDSGPLLRKRIGTKKLCLYGFNVSQAVALSEILFFGGLPSGAVSRSAKQVRPSGLADFVGCKWPYFVLVQAPNRPRPISGIAKKVAGFKFPNRGGISRNIFPPASRLTGSIRM